MSIKSYKYSLREQLQKVWNVKPINDKYKLTSRTTNTKVGVLWMGKKFKVKTVNKFYKSNREHKSKYNKKKEWK